MFSAHVSQATFPRTPHKRLPSLETTLFQPSQHYISVKSSLHQPLSISHTPKLIRQLFFFFPNWGAVFYQGFLCTHIPSIQNICSKCLRNHTTRVYNTNTHFTIVEMDSKEKVQMFTKLQRGTTQIHNSHAENLLQADRFYKCFKQLILRVTFLEIIDKALLHLLVRSAQIKMNNCTEVHAMVWIIPVCF